ncbi:MAG: DEAD/DEAH box helicase, partial [Candidatus Nanopelagicales bacterium]
MRQALRQWIADADTRNNIVAFQLASTPRKLAYQQGREVDLYYSLVSELFDLMRVPPEDARDWVTLGDALAAAAAAFVESVTSSDAFLFAAAAYFWGGNSASAYLTMRRATPSHWASDTYRACYDLLGRPNKLTSAHVQELVDAVRQGDTGAVENAAAQAQSATAKALRSDPDEWIASRLYESLVARFAYVNIRAGLPGSSDPRWDALVASMLDRTPPVWDFFPSQMQAIQAGLLTSSETFSLQMPTGSGKTALMETLIYQHTTARPTDIAVLLVPYRALAGELRRTLVKRLSGMGVTSRAVFGGTVPTAEESEHLGQVQALVSTPESLVGLIGRHPELLARTSLVICDEGHLIDSGDRGVGLELLLTRLRHGTPSPPRVVFASAIVPNIEEINAWLGGTKSTVVRSNFQPAAIDYAVLRPRGEGVNVRVDLELRPTVTALPQHTLPAFLPAARFVYRNPDTGRNRTYPHESIKSQSIAAARRALLLGPVAVFSTTKTGNQGVVALAEELLKQVDSGIDLPRPSDSIPDPAALDRAAEYLGDEYGHDWIGSQTLRAGAVLHHGDIPQETRTVLEELVNSKKVPMVLCTSTLAEGVNLPIRTLVLNSVARRSATGERTPLQPREIRNLVGRAGRPGGATRALVICANPNDWN